jgi:hypothetical protein
MAELKDLGQCPLHLTKTAPQTIDDIQRLMIINVPFKMYRLSIRLSCMKTREICYNLVMEQLLTSKCFINPKPFFEGFQMNSGGENISIFQKTFEGQVLWDGLLMIRNLQIGFELWIKLFHALNI